MKKKASGPQSKNRLLTLENLERDVWGPPTFTSHLVTTCHKLRKKPLQDFTVEDLRMMIGQDIGSKYLLPIALEKLQENPLAEGDFYEGDLLYNVIRSQSPLLKEDRDFRAALKLVCAAALEVVDSQLPKDARKAVSEFVQSS